MFDSNMSYWQSFKIVARGLVQCPLSEDEIDEACDAVKCIGWTFFVAIVRGILFLTIPVSAPIMTLIIHLYRENKGERSEHRRI